MPLTPAQLGVLQVLARGGLPESERLRAALELGINRTRYYQLVLSLLEEPQGWEAAGPALQQYADRLRMRRSCRAAWRSAAANSRGC